MAEPQEKRQKTEDGFKDFLSVQENEELMTLLRIILEELNVGLAHTSVYFVHVNAANANSYTKFSSATITAEFMQRQYRNRLVPMVAPFALLFVRGFAILSDFLNKQDPKIPENIDERRALLELIQFLTNVNEQSVLNEDRHDSKKESEAVLLAQHLLIPLVQQKTLVIDSYLDLQSERGCSVEHPMNGTKGDTSYGCPKGWHGRVDVLLGEQVPVSVVEAAGDKGNADAVSVMSDSWVEVEKDDTFSPESISQVMAQTIVNSFVQHKRNPVSSNSLVPGIGIYSKKMVVYMYDCVEDILLTSGPVALHADMNASGLNYRAIIILWLGLNYKLFGNATPPKYKHYTSDFHHVIGPVQLERYKQETEQPFKGKLDEEDFVKLFNEAKETACSQDKVSEFVPERKSISLN
ncbi:uncharacterized protein LOC123562717 [Mercenaria mercenaria]|uniref:uncharacterized protein LOC123562717 n=1 Tax=Mercenaria mercenaria TaxID=6596 RepID=UPI00234F1C11|nr:uncharacterized protein LOC123562717 [Mercenaria mercenaria]